MVGVPGRSKGCHTCLKRRVKCDESRPTCKRCEKAGYACGGYERKLELRFHTFADQADQPTTSTATTTSSSTATATATTSTAPPPPPTTKTSKDPPVIGPIVPQTLVLHSNDNDRHKERGCVLAPELSFVAFEDNIQFSYLFDNFVWSGYGTPWLQMSAAGKMNALSLEACRAFSLSIFGRHHHQPDIEVRGAIHYDKAVRALSSRLCHVGSPGSETLLVPIMILLMHSATTPDPQAAAFHIQGLLKLIQICGPERFASDPLRLAFESCRATLVTLALITKTRSFLEQPQWLTEPWATCGEHNKSPQNKLVDILVHIPGFLQDQAQLEQSCSSSSSTASESEQFRLDLIQRVGYQLAKAHNWRWHWEEVNQDVAWEVDPELLPADYKLTATRPIKKVLFFSSFVKATELALYNAVVLCLLGLLWTLKSTDQHSPSPLTPPHSPLMSPGEANSLLEPAVEICRAFEFQLLHARQNTDSALFWLFPVGLASKVLEDEVDYMAWIKGMLDLSQVTRGYGTGANTFGFGFYKLPKIARRKIGTQPLIQPHYDSRWIGQLADGFSLNDC